MKKSIAAVLTAGIMAVGVISSGLTVFAEDAEEKTYTVTYNLNDGNTEDMPGFQFLSADMKGLTSYDSRMYVEVDLTLDGKDGYKLVSDCYVVENGKKAEVGDDTGIGVTMTTTAEGKYTDNGNDTVTIETPEHVHHDMYTDTYSVQMKEAAGMNVVGETEDGSYDSDDLPEMTSMVPETVFTLNDKGEIVTYNYLHPEDYETEETEDGAAETSDAAAAGNELIAIPSDDEGTTFTLFDNGTYEFYFASYDVKDNGTYTYDADSQTLTITDANGKETTSTVDGANVKFHYEYSESDQLTGDYTVEAAALVDALK
nr:hypothetical protein [uncultured Blautia sp.]